MYTAIVTIPQYTSPPIDSLSQFAESGRKWVSDWPTTRDALISYFQYMGIENVKERLYKLDEDNSSDDPSLIALKKVMESKGEVVYFLNEELAKYYIDEHKLGTDTKNKYYFSKEKFLPASAVLYCKKDVYFMEYLSRAMLLLRDMHILQMEDDQYSLRARIIARVAETPPPTDEGLIELEHMTVAGKIIGATCGVALISLIVEILTRKIKALDSGMKAQEKFWSRFLRSKL